MPGWVAVIVQVPVVSRLIEKPLTVHTADVVDISVTANPELAVGLTLSGDWMSVEFGGFAKVIVWATFDTVNERMTGAAGA